MSLRNIAYQGPQTPAFPVQTEAVDIVLDPPVPTEVTIDDEGGVILGFPKPKAESPTEGFNENLAEVIGDSTAGLAQMILQGIDADRASRKDWIDNYTKGLDLLGLKIETASNVRGTTGSGGVSKANHTSLLEACVRFQSLARAELLPAAGPCKVEVRGGAPQEADDLAQQLEADINYLIVKEFREYVPDMDRGLFWLGFSGNLFRKGYYDPIKRRPAVMSVNVVDLIISEDASDIDTAFRVTHRVTMSPSVFRRMQLVGAYRDIEVGLPMPTPQGPAQQKTDQVTGENNATVGRPEDKEREIYETYTDIDLSDYGYREKGQPDGLPLPYRVSIDVSSQRILEIRRDWKEGDEEFRRRRTFVHYGMIPGLGFLCMGYLHLLGNMTRALRGILRILIDSGMFANFPGGIKSKNVRTATNQFNPGPGEFIDVDAGEFDDIKLAFMPMPYRDVSANLLALYQAITQDLQRLAGTPEMEVGEGRTNTPVGTVMTMIEQQTQVMAAVHKRLHTAQAAELEMLRDRLAEDPGVVMRFKKNASTMWTQMELEDVNLIPASDPNVPAQMHRMMQSTAILALSASAPELYDQAALHKRALRSIGVTDVDTLMKKPGPMGQQPPPDPAIQAAMMEAEQKKADLKFKEQDALRKSQHEALEAQQENKRMQSEAGLAILASRSNERIAKIESETEKRRIAAELIKTAAAERQAEMAAREAEKNRKAEAALAKSQAAKTKEQKPTGTNRRKTPKA